jgi:RNase adaptor protein for sRNA GlmZ degradation
LISCERVAQLAFKKETFFNASELLQKIIEEIETNISTEISFFCNHGKHRSVGWTEILKKYYYPKSIIKHNIGSLLNSLPSIILHQYKDKIISVIF